MKNIADELRRTVSGVLSKLENIRDDEASKSSRPEKWSKKQILGHLIDSASNNQQKFVRTMAESGIEFAGYAQNHWVESQKYNDTNWRELIVFWKGFNFHIAHIIEHVDPNLLSNMITIDGVGPFTLEFIMTDYSEHLKHHLKQILPDADLESSFKNIY